MCAAVAPILRNSGLQIKPSGQVSLNFFLIAMRWCLRWQAFSMLTCGWLLLSGGGLAISLPKMASWTCDYDGLPCRCLPLAECFARDAAWRYQLSTGDGNFHRKRRSHLSAHEEHEYQADLLLQVADRVQRCDPRGWRCACGMTLPQVSAVLRHECASEKSLALPVRSALRKCHPALQAQPQVIPKTNAGLANKMSFYNDAAASLAMVTVDNSCNESLLLPLQPAKRCLQLGDFFPHPDTKDAFCCVWSPPAHGAAMVVDLHPFPRWGDCRQHSGGSGCWRFSPCQEHACVCAPDMSFLPGSAMTTVAARITKER